MDGGEQFPILTSVTSDVSDKVQFCVHCGTHFGSLLGTHFTQIFSKLREKPLHISPPPKDLPETPVSDFEYGYNGSLGGVEITKYNGTSMKVRIPDKIEDEPVAGIGKEAFARSGIMYVYIPNSVTSIGERAFAWCTGLTSITIPDSVTFIAYYTFGCCTALADV